MLRGEAEYALDEKGRVVIPPKFRVTLGERVIVTRWIDPCLGAFSPIGPALQSCAYAGAMVVLWQNRHHPWIPVVLAGLALNSLVMLLNGGRMPLSAAALAAAAQGIGAPTWAFADPRYVVARPGAPLAALGDAFPIRVAGYAAVVSAGDLLMSVGLAGFVQRHMVMSRAPELPSPTL